MSPGIKGVVTAVARARAEPEWFCDHILQSPNDPWQGELLEALADIERFKEGTPTRHNHGGLDKITVRSPHNPGKTHWIAKCMHWFNFTHRGRIIATAPKEDQIKTRLWPEFRKILRGSIDEYQQLIDVDRTSITWAGDLDWCALAETGANPENIAGHHYDRLLFLVDEASGVKEELFPAIEAALGSGVFVAMILIGNPTRTTGTFYQSHMRDKVARQYYRKHVTPDEAPRISRAWIADMETKYGKNSPVVKVRCYGEFATTEADQLVALEWLQAARDREPFEDGSFPRLRVSVDVSDGGEDETVIIVAQLFESFELWLKIERHSFPSSLAPIMTADAAEQAFQAYGGKKAGDDIVVDSLGVGAGTAGTLLRRGYNVITYKGGAGSDNDKLWRNRRVQSYLALRNALRDGRVVIADDFCIDDDWEDFAGQMCSIKRRPGIERVEDLMTKRELLKLIGKSPDMADAAAMLYATKAPDSGIQVDVAQVLGTLESANYGADWNV